jgi:hypothetical protein
MPLKDHERALSGAVHEAGHAVVRWVLACPFQHAYVRTEGEIRKSKGPSGGISGGAYKLTEPMFFQCPPGAHFSEQAPAEHTAVELEKALAGTFGGAAGEASYLGTDMDTDPRIVAGSQSDRKRAEEFASFWSIPAERKHAILMAKSRAMAICSSQPGQQALRLIAEQLMKTGRIEWSEVVMICERIYQQRAPGHDYYVQKGLPTLGNLRVGILPASGGVPVRASFYKGEARDA